MFERLLSKNESILRSEVYAFISTTGSRYSSLRSGKAILRAESRTKPPVYSVCFSEGLWTVVRLRGPII